MCALPRRISMGIGTENFPAGTHMCYIFNEDDEKRNLIAKYIESGLRGGEIVRYFAETPSAGTLNEMLSDLGVKPPVVRPGQFQLAKAAETYCPDGTFIPERMLAGLRTIYDEAIADGYAGARASGEMGWALQGLPGSDRLIEYEALINTIVEEHPITALCQYDARRFGGDTLFDVLSVHPMMVVRGQIVRNPYYIPPEAFLAARSARV
jgi:hypothetical protein